MAGKSMKPGGGGRFQKAVKDIKKNVKTRPRQTKQEAAEAIAAAAGRKKYGNKKMANWSAAGRKRARGR